MTILLKLDQVLEERGISLTDLAIRVGSSYVSLLNIKNGRVQGLRFSTLDSICKALGCQPGDILEHIDE